MTRHPAVAVLAIAVILEVGAVIAPTRVLDAREANGPTAANPVGQHSVGSAPVDALHSWPITYRVTSDGTTASSITWTDGSSQSQAIDVLLPWTVSLPAGSLPGHIVLAQAGDGSVISCTITQGRELMDATTGAGRGAIALCQE